MAESVLNTSRSRVAPVLASVSGFIVLFFFAMWLRVVPLEPDPVLQGYLQVTTGLLAFVFAAVILVRFQGTQDRISLILGAGFLLSGTILTASSLLFFSSSRPRCSCAGRQFPGGSAVSSWRCSF